MRTTISLLALSAFFLALGASCVDRKESELAPEADSNQAAIAMTIDAAPAAPVLPTAPLTGTHIDGEGSQYRPAGSTFRGLPPSRSQGKEIELVLRSSPPGAIASIDGKPIGNTPTFWRGAADGTPHEYTFAKQGYSIARYRFVATQSGVVHGALKALVVGSEGAAPKGTAAH